MTIREPKPVRHVLPVASVSTRGTYTDFKLARALLIYWAYDEFESYRVVRDLDIGRRAAGIPSYKDVL